LPKEDKRLGRGLDALLPKPKELLSEEVIKVESDKVMQEISYKEDLVARLAEEVKRNPRLVIWSPKASLALKILKHTVPNFSVSREAAKLLEEAVKSRYPELWKLVEEAMK